MNNTLDCKCPSCDAVLKYNPESQNWKCDYCRSKFDLEKLKSKKLTKEKKVLEINTYICKNCGAEIITDSNTSATHCIYCNNTVILKDKLEGDFNPDYLLPFKTTKKDVIREFKKFCKGKWLMPRVFKTKRNINAINGVYVPFWLYDFKSSGIIENECDKISTWKSGGYKYIKTDKYSVILDGNVEFEKIPVGGSKKFKNNLINSIEPFDYKELKKFDYAYLSGFLSEKYSIKKDKSIIDANDKAKATFIDVMKKEIKDYDKIKTIDSSINLYNSESSYVLLPIWFLNIKYKNKIYTLAMNGQTGKFVGDVPTDIKKAIFIWIKLFIITFIIIFLINMI